MSESLWNDLDTYLVTEFKAFMNGFSNYKLKSVEINGITDPQSWRSKEFPFASLESRREGFDILEHGEANTTSGQSRFNYVLVCAIVADKDDARTIAKIFDARIRRFLQSQMRSIESEVTDTAGSHPAEIILGRCEISTIPIVGSTSNQYYGIAMRAFDVTAHMEE